MRLLCGELPLDEGGGSAIRKSAAVDMFPFDPFRRGLCPRHPKTKRGCAPHPPDTTIDARTVARACVAPFDEWEREMDLLARDGSDNALLKYGELQESMIRLDGYRINEWIDIETGKLGMPPRALDLPYNKLSGGERTKLLIASLFLKGRLYAQGEVSFCSGTSGAKIPSISKERFLLIDEPTNHLDSRGREKLQTYLSQQSGFLLVSHDRALLDGVCDHIVSINKKSIEVQQGNYAAWKQNHDLQEAAEYKRNERLKGEIGRLNDSMHRIADWSNKVEASKIGEHSADRGFIGAQSARMMKRSKNAERRAQSSIEEKKTLLTDVDVASPLILRPLTYSKPRLIELNNLSVDYGHGALFNPITLDVMRGERIALTGGNGCGKTSVLRLLCGNDIPHMGTVRLGSNLTISYVSQETTHTRGTPLAWAATVGVERTLFMTILRKFGFSREQLEMPVEFASEGQRKKILLATSLCEQAHLYVWDEPLNFIDVASREQIENLILKYQPTMLFVEHDRRFQENVSTRVISLDN
ncbi:MAG: ATP-binding cassette domain-containing protein [Oscillospiraceae bacterium]|nr:ATP-binding cassette domain-containing protein [Oscillospiraceae bacterium]